MPHEDRREEKKTGRKWWLESFDNKLLDGSGGDRRKNLSSSDFLRLFSTLSSQASRASLYPSSSGFSPSFLGSRRQRTPSNHDRLFFHLWTRFSAAGLPPTPPARRCLKETGRERPETGCNQPRDARDPGTTDLSSFLISLIEN